MQHKGPKMVTFPKSSGKNSKAEAAFSDPDGQKPDCGRLYSQV